MTRNTYDFAQVDAFTDTPLSGNPCAIIFDADNLTEPDMLAIAREMNLSETSFVLSSDKADFRFRYFTPAEEIPLAGHPTIATVFSLVETRRLQLLHDQTTITVQLEAGVIDVEISARAGIVEQVTMSQLKPTFLSTYSPEHVLPVFGLAPDDKLPDAPIQTVSTGTPQLMIPVKDHDALRRVQLDIARYKQLRATSDFFSPHLFCLHGITKDGDTFARHFGVPPDTLEDPFTGSATGGMAAYLWHYGLIKQPKFTAEQGHWMNRPGKAFVEVVGAHDNIETVKIGGQAALVLRGELLMKET